MISAGSWRRRSAAGRPYRLSVELLEARQLLSAGALDPTFGSGGQILARYSANSHYDQGNAVAIQPDGKIVVAGYDTEPLGDTFPAVARLNANGSLDGSFGPLHDGTSSPQFCAPSHDQVKAVALQPDGKIVLAGVTGCTSNSNAFLAVRLNADGTLDGTFGPNHDGRATIDRIPASPYDQATAVAVQGDGKIVLAGTADTDGNGHPGFVAARLNADGTLDSGFRVTFVAFPLGSNNSAEAHAVALQPDGKIVLAGSAQSPSGDLDFAADRLNANGTLDASFGFSGKTTVGFNRGGTNNDAAYAVALQPDGKILLAGSSVYSGPYSDWAVARLNADGFLDNSFGGGSKTFVHFPVDGDMTSAYALAVQPDGKIVVAGVAQVGGVAEDFAAARLNADGSFDSAFGSGGQTIVAVGTAPASVANAVALQPDGKIVLAGTSGNEFAVARLTADAPPPPVPVVHQQPLILNLQALQSLLTGKVHRLVLSFDKGLDPASAQNLGHYLLLVPGKGKKHKPHTVPIVSAVYNATTHAVTLTLGKFKSTDKKGTLEVTGLADPTGDVLAGTDVFAVNLSPKAKKH